MTFDSQLAAESAELKRRVPTRGSAAQNVEAQIVEAHYVQHRMRRICRIWRMCSAECQQPPQLATCMRIQSRAIVSVSL